MTRWKYRAVAVLVAMSVAGCADKGPKSVQVSGTVKLDGKPIPVGKIAFYSAEGRPPETAEIEDGAFSLTLTTGAKRVDIRAFRKKKGPISTDPIRPEDPMENYMPKKYNSNSTMTVTIPPPDDKLTYDLTSK
jgi:hypothetical protein